MARPHLPEDERLDRTATIRMTSADLDRLEAVARRLGIKPMAFVRFATLRALERLGEEGPAFLFGEARPAKVARKPAKTAKKTTKPARGRRKP